MRAVAVAGAAGGRAGTSPARSWSPPGRVRAAAGAATRKRTSSGAPAASRTAAVTSAAKWPSIHCREKSFGTETSIDVSSIPTGATAANQVDQVDSLRVSFSRAETSFQTPAASLSGRASTRAETSQSLATDSSRSHTPTVRDTSSGAVTAERVQNPPKCAFCRKKALSNELSQAGENLGAPRGCWVPRGFSGRSPEGFSHGRRRGVRRRAARPRILRRPAARCGRFDLQTDHEAHLPAEHSQAREDSRVPQAHEHARRPRGPQASAPPWPQAPLRLARFERADRAAPAAHPLGRLRRRLPAREVAVQPPPRRVRVRGRRRRARRGAARHHRAAEGRRRRRAQPAEAPAARGRRRARARGHARRRHRRRGPPRPCRGRRDARVRAGWSTSCGHS